MKTKILILLVAVISIMACENQDIEFGDYDFTAVYFPFQTPARSLILGKYDLGVNENDNNSKFEIGVTMTGVYSNKENRSVHFQVAPELLDGVENVVALPENYYTIETPSPVTIPKGSVKGRIEVQLTDAFFEDPLSFAPEKTVNYVVPVLITEVENLDTLLVGKPLEGIINPSRVNEEDWEFTPKDYTLYGIKFMNKYQAIYLRRGVDVMTNAANETITTEYRTEFIERDELVKLTTTGKSNVELSNRIRRGDDVSPGDVNFELVFDNEGSCIVRSFGDDPYNVSGSGIFVEDGDTWGDKKRDVVYLDYAYTDSASNETHKVKDTLVVRDRDVIFEEFKIELTE
ncbi:protein of unknown function [Lutibacter agarilyticus]|uniref:DUF1735 domain-containing protein n=1 Tax=Lutibacter agarilyticus TaxID=1109740 RepID=A0A238Y509_9FLAO|nr:DUF5627 domain-containing protein [Lutibacter agarilyticus]SNR66100.1 protein of unknown function [Lutibacter agarilyticus]